MIRSFFFEEPPLPDRAYATPAGRNYDDQDNRPDEPLVTKHNQPPVVTFFCASVAHS